jgi:hypothetical protein
VRERQPFLQHLNRTLSHIRTQGTTTTKDIAVHTNEDMASEPILERSMRRYNSVQQATLRRAKSELTQELHRVQKIEN